MSETQYFNPHGDLVYGWSCGACRCWVPFGQYHTCEALGVTTDTSNGLNAEWRIALALERIADALEAANDRP